jgi:hypothetical protein
MELCEKRWGIYRRNIHQIQHCEYKHGEKKKKKEKG